MELAGSVMNVPLRAMIAATSQALAAVDVDRLEGLVSSFRVLVRRAEGRAQPFAPPEESESLQIELNLLARVIDATRANLRVLRRASVMGKQLTGYGPEPAFHGKTTGGMYGNN